MPKVSVIPAKPVQVIKGMSKETKKRVCAYCRVSTDSDEQLTSYEAQVLLIMKNTLKANLNMSFVGYLQMKGYQELIQKSVLSLIK